jgi:hypothetical protein
MERSLNQKWMFATRGTFFVVHAMIAKSAGSFSFKDSSPKTQEAKWPGGQAMFVRGTGVKLISLK